MNPQSSVSKFAEIINSLGAFSEEEAICAMAGAGIPFRIASHTYNFTQVAWARALIGNLGISFAPDYLWLSASGDLVESGILAENPYFQAAAGIAGQYTQSGGFQRLAMMSAEFHSINNALNAGSNPKNLVTSTVVMFTEPPTEAGLQKAQQLLHERLASSPRTKPKPPPTKAWWQFWK